ncbi:MAG: hypothetical protein CMK09_06245 [Ponticaulis sp.]|nr:hypothetical protein [Ponticaulis sp.]|tara:strand:- start:8443 stop:9288 length:846 start_codon:yes stop_codon:yes gene_type:complete
MSSFLYRMMVTLAAFLSVSLAHAQDLPQAQLSALQSLESGNKQISQSVAGDLYRSGQEAYKSGKYDVSFRIFKVFSEFDAPISALATTSLARHYWNGYGVAQDRSRAVELYRQAAAKGEDTAMFLLGFAYQEGEGVNQSFGSARDWYVKCANAQGGQMTNCQRGAATMLEKLTASDPQAYQKAFAYYVQCSEAGEKICQRKRAYFMANGRGTNQDEAGAIEWYQKAADQNEPQALNNLGNAYYHGRGVEKDFGRAVELWKRAHELGEPSATNVLRQLGMVE